MPQASCVAADCDAEVPSYGNRLDLLTVVLGGEDPSFCHRLQSIIYFIGISKNTLLSSHNQWARIGLCCI